MTPNTSNCGHSNSFHFKTVNVLILVIFVGVVDILGEAKRGKAVDEEVVLSVVGGVPFLSLGKLHKLCVCGGRVVNVLYTQYTINKMKSTCTCNLIVKIHVHSLHSPTHPHTHYSHTHSHTHTHHTPPYSPNWWPVLCC